jgi:hypothetical protein
MLAAYQSKWHPDVIFEEGQPRKLHGLFSNEAMENHTQQLVSEAAPSKQAIVSLP